MECRYPDADSLYPIPKMRQMTQIRPTITRANIIVGDYSYYAGENFQDQVTHHYDFKGDRLVIGKFCQIAAGVEFMMNGANHMMACASTYPFYVLGWDEAAPPLSALPDKGDTLVGHDVWIGQSATILPGTRIGNGAIIGACSVVGGEVAPYSIVAGNPARLIRHRFDAELTALLQAWQWWDLPYEEIASLIPLLHSADLEYVKQRIKALLMK